MEAEGVRPSNHRPITDDDVNAAQTAWCDALVTMGQVYSEGGDYKAVASLLIDDLYDYQDGTVFFKPTLAFGANAFRNGPGRCQGDRQRAAGDRLRAGRARRECPLMLGHGFD